MQKSHPLPYENLTNLIISSVKRHIPFEHYQIFYFGSRVRGRATSRSDLDIGLKAENKIPFYVMARIEEELDGLPMLQKIDIVDFSLASEDFKREAEKDREIIYEQ
ncbi:MAG: hypothetical protein A3G39_07930 [Deltaproteobacteria bacterium RIFCSPLOWO2_12_FULL_43_16]|nr:MAG: hypothetical protein A2Z89_02795 [Deltaproteobacteria bacterium GWA2_43_19]OGQ12316.1 MAG: hypothetical protein A3D30_03360 [Deltaproteobacteria bacterium RIFCSPHIGHO2_02_FULL_43_33]OGQ41474.1 MAG: hypothetical protein A3A85_05175 [Deltaproteobacteria bacterium RIFCSPLOWO2_01_FULL_42_9]OGQ57271.1 MAG: hypothetical protein A3G39_07930 [Deltaproteobacteria bacterium RIFCSPLOWO2_12_FULL_43_16]